MLVRICMWAVIFLGATLILVPESSAPELGFQQGFLFDIFCVIDARELHEGDKNKRAQSFSNEKSQADVTMLNK